MISPSEEDSSLKSRMDDFLLKDLVLPVLVVETGSGNLVRANPAALEQFRLTQSELPAALSEAVPFHREVTEAIARLLEDNASHSLCAVDLSGTAGLAMISATDDERNKVCVVIYPQARELEKLVLRPSLDTIDVDALGRQLHFERLVRQITSKVYSSLDKDVVVQGLVDNLGRALKVQRCLVIIESSSALPVVTHEYAEADISPLGLGRTAKFPASVFERLLEGVVAVPDVTNLRTVKGVILEDVNDLLDNSVSSMAGVPMVHRGAVHGVIVALQLGRIRKWDVQDLDLLQVAAHHASISLEHCQQHQRLKDQLFNVNVWNSLTQQLTSTLELASRSPVKTVEKQSRANNTEELPALSSRELEVLKLIASGLANKEIANQLFLTESTVELHASRIRKKLKLRSRTALVKYACDHDIV